VNKRPEVRSVKQLCADLNDLSIYSGVRRLAAKALGEIGDARAVGPLIAALDILDTSDYAVEALVKIGRQSNIVRSLVGAFEAEENTSLAEVLQKLGWYPDKKKRVEIMTRDWRIGGILGIPEAIDPIVRALFESPQELKNLQEKPNPLPNTVPHSSLTLDIVNLILIASSYEEKSKSWGRSRDIYYSVEESDDAVWKLCRLVSPITTNILHLVKNKTITFHMSDDDGEWVNNIDFRRQKIAAEEELQRRGNPPYEPKAYLKH